MRRFLLWSFDRGSKPYDVICGIILAFIFLTPNSAFDDRPDYMRVYPETVHETTDSNGNTVFTVKLKTAEAAEALLRNKLGEDFRVTKVQGIYDTTGAIEAYSIWIER